jgi:hypothetical protein
MGRSTRRSRKLRAKRLRELLVRPGVWLATLSTVVGLATGMFTLRDHVFPNETGTAEASVPDFQRSVGQICQELNSADRVQARDTRRVGVLLRKASTTVAQRNALLDSVRRSLARSNHELSILRGLEVPDPFPAMHRDAVATWNRNVERVLSYAQLLDQAATRGDLAAAVMALAEDRRAIARDGVALHARLIRLGGRECRFAPPIVSKTITLPGQAGVANPPTPSINPPAPSDMSASDAGPAQPAPGDDPTATGAPSSTGAPPNRVNTPTADTPVVVGGGDD